MTKISKADKKSSNKNMTKDLDSPGYVFNRRKEWRFGLLLPLVVEGRLPNGKIFRESTTIRNISSGGAYFYLNSDVIVGTKLNLVIDIPDELSGGKNLKLVLGGLTVRIDKVSEQDKKQGVALRFYKRFRILPEGNITP